MDPSNEFFSNRQFKKRNVAHRQRKRTDAVVYSFTSNETFDVASYNKARILRIYREDIWFASNIVLPKGQYVYLGLNMNESDPNFNSNGFHLVRIKRRADSQDSSFRYRYQARYIKSRGSAGKITQRLGFKKQTQKNIHLDGVKDPRSHPRKSCYNLINFSFQNKKYHGIISNLSRSGAYIETNHKLHFAQAIEIAIPVKHGGEDFRLLGKIVRTELNGFGLKFTKALDAISGKKPRTSLPHKPLRA